MDKVIVDDGEVKLIKEDEGYLLMVQINEAGDFVVHSLTANEVQSLFNITAPAAPTEERGGPICLCYPDPRDHESPCPMALLSRPPAAEVPRDGGRAPSPFETFQAGMAAGLLSTRHALIHDYTEAEVRQEFRDWLDERAADALPTPPPPGVPGQPGFGCDPMAAPDQTEAITDRSGVPGTVDGCARVVARDGSVVCGLPEDHAVHNQIHPFSPSDTGADKR